jgi:hypothetical protein
MMAKKRKPAAKKEEELFFVGISDPIELRRSVLESSKDLLHYLSRFEKFKNVRNEKAEYVAQLNDVTAEIKKLVNKLRTALPQTKLRAQLHKREEKVAKAAAEKVKARKRVEKQATLAPRPMPKKKPTTDLEKLEAELSAIEGRLTKM